MSVKEKLKALEALQNVDVEALELQRAGEAYPKRLSALDAELSKAKDVVEAERSRLAQNEAARRQKEQDVASEKDKVKKWEGRLAELRTTREYAALAREIDIAKKVNLNFDEELKLLGAEHEELKKTLAGREGEFRHKEDASAAERASLSEKIGTLNAALRELAEKRAEVSTRVEPALLAKYDAIRKKKGQGVVPVAGGTCRGCNMRIPPQLNNILRSGATIESCPSCQRLIYAAEVLA